MTLVPKGLLTNQWGEGASAKGSSRIRPCRVRGEGVLILLTAMSTSQKVSDSNREEKHGGQYKNGLLWVWLHNHVKVRG